MMRALIISHAAVIDINQEPFHALAQDGVDLTLIAPRALRTDLRGSVALSMLPGFAGAIVPLRVVFGGHRRALGGQRGIHLIAYRGLARAIRDARPDVIFVEEEPYSIAARQAARAAAGTPFVVHQNQNIARRLPMPFEAIRRTVLARAAGVTVRNAAAEEIVRAHGFLGPIARFPHGVDLARFEGRVSHPTLPSPVVGFIGRLVAEKGILELIEAAAAARASLLVIGDGPMHVQARSHAKTLGVPAEFTGALAHGEVPARYGQMDLVAVPSRTTPTWKEQFGRVIIEANAAGIPAIVSDSGELPHTLAATGGGVVVREGDAESLRHALTALCQDSEGRHALGERGRAAVERSFTPRAIGAALHVFLREAAS